MARLRVLSRRGDDTYHWDPKGVASGDPDATAAVREAERIFQAERARGALAFRVTSGRPGERIDRFDPQAEQIILVPKLAGG
jgi:hypothetical protein